MIKQTPNHVVHECVNCGNHFHGDFCNGCGQRVMPRFTAVYLWQRFNEDIIGIESGLFRTFKELWLKPGEMISSYIGGATGRYYGPFKYLIIWTAVYLLALIFIGRAEQHPPLPWEQFFHAVQPFSAKSIEVFKPFINWVMEQQTNFYLMGIIPFFATAALLFFRNNGFNLTELIIFYTYFSGHFSFCAFAANSINIIPIVNESKLSTLLIFGLYFYLFFKMHLQFFAGRVVVRVAKTVGIYVTGTLTNWLMLFIAAEGIRYFVQQ